MFHSQVTHLGDIFQKNGYPGNFIHSCFKLLLSRTHIFKEKVPTVLPYLGTTSSQTGNKIVFLKFLHQLWFTSFSVDYSLDTFTENVFDMVNILVYPL